MKNGENKKITLESLARMVAEGFEKTATKEETNLRFNSIEQRLGKLDYRVDEIREILERFEEGDILDLQKRIKILERTVKAMAKHLE